MADEKELRHEKEHEVTATDTDLGRELVDRLTAVPGTDSIGMEVLRRHRSYLGKRDLSMGRWSLSREAMSTSPDMEWLHAGLIGARKGKGVGRSSTPADRARATPRVAAADSAASGVAGSLVAPSPVGVEATKVELASVPDVSVGSAVAVSPSHSLVARRSEGRPLHVSNDSPIGHGSDKSILPAPAPVNAAPGAQPAVQLAAGMPQAQQLPVTAVQPTTVYGGPPIYQRSKQRSNAGSGAQRPSALPRISEIAAGSDVSPSAVQRDHRPEPVFAQRKLSTPQPVASVQQNASDIVTRSVRHDPLAQRKVSTSRPDASVAEGASEAATRPVRHDLLAQSTLSTPQPVASIEESASAASTRPLPSGASQPMAPLTSTTPESAMSARAQAHRLHADRKPDAAQPATTSSTSVPAVVLPQRVGGELSSGPQPSGDRAAAPSGTATHNPSPVLRVAAPKLPGSSTYEFLRSRSSATPLTPVTHGLAESVLSRHRDTSITHLSDVVHTANGGGPARPIIQSATPLAPPATVDRAQEGSTTNSVIERSREVTSLGDFDLPVAQRSLQQTSSALAARKPGLGSAGETTSVEQTLLQAKAGDEPHGYVHGSSQPALDATSAVAHTAAVPGFVSPQRAHAQSGVPVMRGGGLPLAESQAIGGAGSSAESALNHTAVQRSTGLSEAAISTVRNNPTQASLFGPPSISSPAVPVTPSLLAPSEIVSPGRAYTANLPGSPATGTTGEASTGPGLVGETRSADSSAVNADMTPQQSLQTSPLLHADRFVQRTPAVARTTADPTFFHNRAAAALGAGSALPSRAIQLRPSSGTSNHGPVGPGLFREPADRASAVAASVVVTPPVTTASATQHQALQPAPLAHADRSASTAPPMLRVEADSGSLNRRADAAPSMQTVPHLLPVGPRHSIGMSARSATNVYLPQFADRTILERATEGDSSREAFGRGPVSTLHHAMQPASMQHVAPVAQSTPAVHRSTANGTMLLSPAPAPPVASPIPPPLTTAPGGEQPIGASAAGAKGVDVAQLANRVYELLVRRLASERQRRGA